jgi:predicted ATPase/DNA-binding winged helix-turn-helix (wHTH) protein
MDSGTTTPAIPGPEKTYSFGPFRFDPLRRELRDANGAVHAGSRALQLLAVLLEHPGRLCSRDELVGRVWPDTVVEETSLRVHMSALRRILGDGQDAQRYITNVPGRGYSFVGEVVAVAPTETPAPTTSATKPASPAPPSRLPARLNRPIGRGQDIARVGEWLTSERLVSIVGAGGMGKTTVALAVAENLDASYAQGAVFVNLSALSDEQLLVVEVGQCFGLDVARGEPWAALENALRDQQVLIVLDNCEHMIAASAVLVDRLLRACPRVRILATSREPLEAEGEWVLRLPPLEVPKADADLTVADVLSYPAVQLFVDRARAAGARFELTEGNAREVRQLCEFLDGIPLAIELAAARVHGLGIHGLLHRLEDAFDLLTRGKRTAMSRHQTLHAVMDWSYELLTETERCVLQRLSVFRSAFDLEAAIAVASSPTLSGQRVVEAVLDLCGKSLLVQQAEHDGGSPRHRLLYITRLFAERLLATAPDAPEIHRRHAAFVLQGLRDPSRSHEILTAFGKGPALTATIAEMRAAIAWTLVEENDILLGLEIVADSNLVWHVAGLVEECGKHLGVALEKVRKAGAGNTRLALRLQTTLELFSSAHVLKDSASHRRALSVSRDLVDAFEKADDKLEALYALCVSAFGRGEFLLVLDCCEEIRELARAEWEPIAVAVGDRFAALALHELGQHVAAERLAYRVMQVDPETLDRRFRGALSFSLSLYIRLARIHWLRADFRSAWAMVQQIEQGPEVHSYARCHVLALAAIPIAIWKGDLASANRWNQELLLHSTRTATPYWQAFANMYRALLDGLDPAADSPEAQQLELNVLAMDTAAALRSTAPHSATLARVRDGEVGWCAPEVLRLAALASFDPADEIGRARCIAELRSAHDLGLEQGARFWSLRSAISLVEVAPEGHPDHDAARGLLQSLLNGIDDGSTQPDLQRARRLVARPLSSLNSDRA